MKLILLLTVVGFIQAGPQLDGTMKDVNPAPPEVFSASEEDPTPEVPTSVTRDLSKSRRRRDINAILNVTKKNMKGCMKECIAKGEYDKDGCKLGCKFGFPI